MGMPIHRKAALLGIAMYGNFFGWAVYGVHYQPGLWPLIPMFGGLIVFGLWATAVLRCPKCGEITYEKPVRLFGSELPIRSRPHYFHRRCYFCGFDLRTEWAPPRSRKRHEARQRERSQRERSNEPEERQHSDNGE
jgi:hypothetical protein